MIKKNKLNLINEIKKLAKLINTPFNILVVSHYNPDGDAIGSLLAMVHYLNKKGHKVSAMVPNEIPHFLRWLKDSEKVIIFQKNQKKAFKIIGQSDIIICVDFNTPGRIKGFGSKLIPSKAIKVLIDHHPNPDNIFDINLSDISVSSTAELIYKFILKAGDRKIIDSVIAECIFAGIMADTGCFSYNSSNPETFQIVADLLTCDINKDKIYNLLYDNFSSSRIKLMGYCLNEKMVIIPEFHVAYISLTREEMARYNFKTGDSEGFVNIPFSVKGIYITALFTEQKDHIRISFRSRGDFAINEFCEKHFDGGGHKNAAGGESKLPLKETIEKFEKLLNLYHNEIENIQLSEN